MEGSPSSNEVLAEAPPVLRFRLETDLESFEKVSQEFLHDLAAVTGLDEQELRIAKIQLGCVEVFVEMLDAPDDTLLWLVQVAKREALDTDGDAAVEVFLEKYNVTHVTRIKKFPVPYVSQFLEELTELEQDGEILTWLHISDLHARLDAGGADQPRITSKFLEDIPGLLTMWGLAPDVAFLTGDVAHSGKTEEYGRARGFLDGLIAVLPTAPPLFMVPGNHDVTWESIDPDFDERLDAQLTDQREVDQFFYASDAAFAMRKTARLRLDNFFEFMADAGDLGQPPFAPHAFYYTHTLDHGSVRIGIAGLNSTWRSTRKDQGSIGDLQRLVLGAGQLTETARATNDADLRIALVHHPPGTEWYKPFDRRAHKANLQTYDFILRGHEHTPDAIDVHEFTTGTRRIEVPAGALYSSDDDYPNSFNVIRLNLTTGRGCAFFWRYFEDVYRWKEDVGLADRGRKFFDLPPQLISRLEAAAIRAEDAAATVPDEVYSGGATSGRESADDAPNTSVV